jgi:outer membrane protein OmpA-like peptidoglycan-associated protein
MRTVGVALLVAMIACAGMVHAQNLYPLQIGAGAGYGLGIHSLSDPGIACNGDPACPQYSGGTGGGALFGVSADWRMSHPFGILLRASYFGSAVSMSTTISDAFARDGGGNVVPLVRTHTLNVKIPEATIDLFGSWRAGIVRVFAGPSLAFLLSPTWNSSARITSPNNVTYATNIRDTQFWAEQGIPNVYRSAVDFTIGAGVDLPLTHRVVLAPEISYSFPLQSLRTVDTWKKQSLRLIASVRYGFGGGCEPREVRDNMLRVDTVEIERAGAQSAFITGVPVSESVVHSEECVHRITMVTRRTDTLVSTCVASPHLQVMAVYPDGERKPVSRITVHAYFVTEVFPLLPRIFFEDGSSAIPGRYHRVAAPHAFAIDSVEPNALALHYDLLNIVGTRMRNAPAARLTVRGYADPKTERGDCQLARLRAEEIKAYLVTTWGIDTARIVADITGSPCVADALTMSPTPKGYADNRHAMLESNDTSIMQPIKRAHYIDAGMISPPALEFDPAGTTLCGGTRYALHGRQHNMTVVNQTVLGALRPVVHPMTPLEARTLESGTPLECMLAVIDRNGHEIESPAVALPVIKDTSEEEIQRLSLTLFEVSQDRIRDDDKRAITAFVAGVDAGAPISVVGYTDNIGDNAYNIELSDKRAKSITAFIRSIVPSAHIVRVAGVGRTQYPPGIVTYDTPEERDLCRTVQIEIRSRR